MNNTRELSKLQEAFKQITPNAIRNVCIIAHVDHGKTTVADALISASGMIPPRLVGKLRVLDSREDEQLRGITMKSSVISLFYDPLLLNLVDSPGHVDFSAEVNSALNVADVALLVVDAVEGVCSQTESLLRQAVLNQVQVILVINKMDRLITELKLSEAEGFRHIQRLIENVNSVLSQIFQGLVMEEHWNKIDDMELQYHFNPSHGNVLFASAIYGYAFSVGDFASKWAPKLKLEARILEENLFSDSYYAGGNILPDAEQKGRKSLFEQLILQPLWEVYKHLSDEKEGVSKLNVVSQKLGLPPLKAKRLEDTFHELMRTWMPMSNAVIRSVANCQSSKVAFTSEDRILRIFPSNDNPMITRSLKECDPSSDFVLLFVMKLYVVGGEKLTVVRVFNGTLKTGQKLYSIHADKTSESTEVQSISLMLGKDLIPVDHAPAGSIVAIHLPEFSTSSTLCSASIESQGLHFDIEGLEPLVRVTIRTSPDIQNDLKQGLKHLAMLDTAVRVFEQEDGELALVTAGEVHLQKCLQDLAELGLTQIEVSEPIIPFLETIVADVQSSYAKIVATHLTECTIKVFNLHFAVRAVPLSTELVEVLQKHEKILKLNHDAKTGDTYNEILNEIKLVASATLPGFKGTFWLKKTAEEVEKLFEKIWSFGPNKAKCNILLNAIGDDEGITKLLERFLLAGFELAMNSGPLCDEPVHGVAIIWEELELTSPTVEDSDEPVDLQSPQLQGQMISATKQTLKAALRKTPMRLVTPMYKCKVQTTTNSLGKVHTVLGQRHAKIIDEDINQATGFFEIECFIPIAESFDFCDQLRKKTSGVASAQTQFSHWQVIDEDPFWQPSTEEELEEFGEKGDTENQARLYMNNVRRRKGLATDEVLVVNAEKQRNLNRKK